MQYGRCHRPTLLFVTLFQTRYCSVDKCTNGPRQERSRVHGTKVPGNKRSRERTVQGTNVPRNEWSRERKFHHGNECSRERIVLGTNIPDTSLTIITCRYITLTQSLESSTYKSLCSIIKKIRRMYCFAISPHATVDP